MNTAEKLTAIADNCAHLYERGIEAANDAWSAAWDGIQTSGSRRQYGYCFMGGSWTDHNFLPKYDIVPTQASSMFHGSMITDLAERLRQAGVTMDLSRCTNLQSMFQDSGVTVVPSIDTTGATKMATTFAYARHMHTIERLILKQDGSQTFLNPFVGATALENITVEGTIGNDLSFDSCTLLSHDSLMSILAALKDYSAVGGSHSCALGTANLAKLTDTEKVIATEKGWTLT